MPFDGADYHPSDPKPARPPGMSDNALSYGIAVFAAVMLLLPISLGSLVDIVKYLQSP